ncbi:VWA domain-containing protein [Chloroflexota bacterium]
MGNFIYSEWDGSQELSDLDTDRIMDELRKHIFRYGDMSQAIRSLQRFGFRDNNRQVPNLNKLRENLRRMKKNHLERYNLDSIMDEIKQKLDAILETERRGIRNKLDDISIKAGTGENEVDPEVRQRLLNGIKDRAARNLARLDELPDDISGRIKELADYDFIDEDARNQFKELMDTLKRQAVEQFGKDMVQSLNNMDSNALADMRHMIEAFNQMLEQRMKGETPDFDGFMQQFGKFFGDNPPRNLEELVENMQKQIARARSLMNSLSPETRQQLQELMGSMLDDATRYELAKMASYMERLFPADLMQNRYPFSGEESVSYQEAMKLMESLQKMDKLEQQMEGAGGNYSPDNIDESLVREVMGEEAERELEFVREMTRQLEEAGYIKRQDDRYDITPRGMRKIGQQALNNIFSRLMKDRVGGHDIHTAGPGNERIEETKRYEFGDDFHIHIRKTIMNALMQKPALSPVKIDVEDFEILKTEETTRSATVIMLDQSQSMFLNGYFESAKEMTIALDSLIRVRFPKDALHVLTFSRRAREIKEKDLLFTSSGWGEQGTNYQDALHLARKLLAAQTCKNKEIILVTDGEPTAHLEEDQVYFQYPPSIRTLQKTLKEVKACTAQRIVINTFMFESSPFFTRFINHMAGLNKGRVFYTDPDSLGKYVLRDYLLNKYKRLG